MVTGLSSRFLHDHWVSVKLAKICGRCLEQKCATCILRGGQGVGAYGKSSESILKLARKYWRGFEKDLVALNIMK
jgi:hypothetical protein